MKLKIQVFKEEKLIIDKIIEYEQNKDVILFQLEEIEHQIDMLEKTFERYNDEFHFYLNFEKEECTYELKSHQAVFHIIVDQSFFEVNDKGIELSYALETDDQKCTILLEFQK